jgi:hypothetical protein
LSNRGSTNTATRSEKAHSRSYSDMGHERPYCTPPARSDAVAPTPDLPVRAAPAAPRWSSAGRGAPVAG